MIFTVSEFMKFIPQCFDCGKMMPLNAFILYAKLASPITIIDDKATFEIPGNRKIKIEINLSNNDYICSTAEVARAKMTSLNMKKITLARSCSCGRFSIETDPLEFDVGILPLSIKHLNFAIQMDNNLYSVFNNYKNNTTTIKKCVWENIMHPAPKMNLPLVEFNYTDINKLKNRLRTLVVFG